MLLGFVLIAALNYRRMIGATLIGILAVTIIGLPFGLAHFKGIVSMPPSLAPTFLQLDFSRMFEVTFLIVVFSILFVDVFDNAGTLIGVTHRTGLMKNGKLARMKEALISDSFAAMFGAAIGTSTTTSYIESAAGVSAGGRTGLTAVFVSIFFLLALLFAPLAGMIPAYATAAALLYVACVMARGLAEIDWEDITEYAPAVVTAITMPLTYSIATGIGLGFITYALAKLISGKVKEASPAVLVLAVLFAVKFAVADEPVLVLLLADMGGAVGDLCRAHRDLRQGRRRERQFRPRHLHPHHRGHRHARISAGGDRAIPVARFDLRAHLSVPAAVGAGDRRVVALLFPRAQDRRGRQGGADRQIVGGAGGDIRRDVSGRAAERAELARHCVDRGRRGAGGLSVIRRPSRLGNFVASDLRVTEKSQSDWIAA